LGHIIVPLLLSLKVSTGIRVRAGAGGAAGVIIIFYLEEDK